MTMLRKLSRKMQAWVDARVTESEDGCWLWNGATAHDGKDPKTWFAGRVVTVRRLIYNATRAKPLERNEHAVGSCECARCIRPDHIEAKTKSAIQKGRPKSASHAIAIAKARRANAKITADDVLEIRASSEPAKAIAQRLGVHHTFIQDIRRHEAWKDYSSPFAGLLSANESNRRSA